MHKLYIANDSKQAIGGGWSFISNLVKGLEGRVEFVDDYLNADIILLPSSSMVNKESYSLFKQSGKKIVLRVDGVPRNSRNRNTGTSRLFSYALGADAVVYQADWSRNYLRPFLQKDGVVIYNGVDTEIFKPEGVKKTFAGSPVYLYSRYNRDETKNWEVAWYKYQLLQRQHKGAKLIIVGRFSDEQKQCNFDFFMGENVEYLGVIEDREQMAQIYRGVDYLMATYWNDCYSNTYQEAMACGVALSHVDLSGGTPEMLEQGVRTLNQMANDYMEVFEELCPTIETS